MSTETVEVEVDYCSGCDAYHIKVFSVGESVTLNDYSETNVFKSYAEALQVAQSIINDCDAETVTA